jgi:hypothetical protein
MQRAAEAAQLDSDYSLAVHFLVGQRIALAADRTEAHRRLIVEAVGKVPGGPSIAESVTPSVECRRRMGSEDMSSGTGAL